jgi:hypothetical protein
VHRKSGKEKGHNWEKDHISGPTSINPKQERKEERKERKIY